MDGEQEKKSGTQASSSQEQDQQVVAESAQNVEGSGQIGTQSAAAAAIAVASSSRNDTTIENIDATAMARFQNSLTGCMEQFRGLGVWIGNQIDEYMENVNVPDILRKFNALPLYQKILIMILILGFVALLRTLVWEGVAFIWPHVMSFINSLDGQEFLSSATSFLESLANSGVLASFTRVLTNAAITNGEESNSGNAGALEEAPCFSLDQWRMLESTTALPIIHLIRSFFNFMMTNAMKK